MTKTSTPLSPTSSTTASAATQQRVYGPRRSTLERIRQVARAYSSITTVSVPVGGMMLN